ncbi:hypothetical protein RHMOL_Rhmol11G0123300 [Rhododendron molle]|uniref:Uncharacterized protein n=1 Tax=Rhododendron molle TaxID=49168 RepID=A0ACC0LRL9_RHOML|nr:hypothetical protein RHMOL_Rhmol11G0123300 [Rhododendron molle]
MLCRTLEINLLSAYDLQDVLNLFSMKVYTTVSIAGTPRTEKRTPADYHGGVNPAWNLIYGQVHSRQAGRRTTRSEDCNKAVLQSDLRGPTRRRGAGIYISGATQKERKKSATF